MREVDRGDPERIVVQGAERGLVGAARVPGDKSISHRALLFNALGEGEARLSGLLGSEDVWRTREALVALGVPMARGGEALILRGRAGALSEPSDVIDCGNSGTTLRLLLGALAGQPFFTALTGDASLRSRPQARVARPLVAMGATVDGRAGGDRAPIAIRGRRPLQNQRFDLPIASAQVATALLLAGLSGEGEQEILLPGPARDHSERMLQAMGAPLEVEALPEGARRLRLAGPAPLRAVDLQVPGDVSSAAFLLVAAAIIPGSALEIQGVGLNPTRTGALDALVRMGAQLTVEVDSTGGEPAGLVRVSAGELRGVTIEGHEIPRLIDEIPALAIAAARAHGVTEIRGAAELRHKESDRLSSTAALVRALGAQVEERPDGLSVEGVGGAPFAPFSWDSGGDHRLAMAAVIAGLGARGESGISGAGCVATSFPGFAAALSALGARLSGEHAGGSSWPRG